MRQKLGQHFLRNYAVVLDILQALQLGPNSHVVEIGPGNGELTLSLFKHSPSITVDAIEKDGELANALSQSSFAQSGQLRVLTGDARRILPELAITLPPGYILVSNVPYYITGRLFRLLGELSQKPSRIVLMIQKEVAERVTATPPHMNLLAASVQIWADAHIVTHVSKKSFSPPPKVDSAVICLVPHANNSDAFLASYYTLIHAVFRQPRKTLLNNLSELMRGEESPRLRIMRVLQDLHLDPSLRPHMLSIQNLVTLTQKFFETDSTRF